ncbi:hypothetical protein IW492_14920 [Enterococcus sp. BWB1-3]|uniref:hypothetical protein n=1 Tax=Enterococcus sp. BWB1-3 TaxID=2787713 RepID=UPI001920DE39|nr:hypothetical protein [Enterococcus sp. BWB1-3]MBL1230521.1 hypothetical protein [Enterococcus sp. BWB1-3]
MKELLKSRLDRIDDLNDRLLLKQIINGVFSGLADYTDTQLQEIRNQVFDEIQDDFDQFDIYYHFLPKDEVDPISDFFFPVDEKDLEELEEMKELSELVSAAPEVFLSKVYLDCDYLNYQTFMQKSENRLFKGEIETNNQTYNVKFRVRPYTGYIEKLKHLYINFADNGLPWKTVLHPYLYKFISIHLADPLPLEEQEIIRRISFNLEEMEPYQRINHVPLWNVRQLEIRNESFAVPALDHINFQHTVNIEKFGLAHGYLVDTSKAEISYVKKTEGAITIISPNERVLNWQIYQFIQPEAQNNPLTLQSNHRNDFFTDRFARRENFTIRSMCEISRIINTYQMMERFSLEEIRLLEQLPTVRETYEVNSFLEDYLREEMDRTPMLLSFKSKSSITTVRDELSFLVSEIQLHFPEFTCIGELL